MNRPLATACILTVTIMLLILPTTQAADIELNEDCTLADAITAANIDAAVGGCLAGNGADTITIIADIPLRAELPEISSAIVIEGEGYRISGAAENRIFFVGPDGDLSINNLHLLDGRANDCRWLNREGNVEVDADSSCGGAILNLGVVLLSNSSIGENSSDEKGGGIYNSRTGGLHIVESSFNGNVADDGGGIYNLGKVGIIGSDFSELTAYGDGGAITNFGEINISNSSFSNNSTVYRYTYGGGAIRNRDGGKIIIARSLFQGNLSSNSGGAIQNGGELNILDSSFKSNRAEAEGGAIYNSGWVSIVNTTISANEANMGGGISITGEATIIHLTIAHNTADRGGGLFMDDEVRARVRLRNTIIANNRSRDCFGTIDANDANLDTRGTCNAVISGAPVLGELIIPEDGSPPYYPLLEGSPAIDVADSLFCPDTDIIGTPRPQGEGCDIGAFEYVGPNSG